MPQTAAGVNCRRPPAQLPEVRWSKKDPLFLYIRESGLLFCTTHLISCMDRDIFIFCQCLPAKVAKKEIAAQQRKV